MQWLRTISCFVRVLVTLFVVAQFAGIITSPLASARNFSTAVALHLDHHHGQHNGDRGPSHHHHGNHDKKDGADHCCALIFAGILPPPIALDTLVARGQQLAVGLTDIGLGVAPGQLDRPPKSLLI